MKKLKKETEKIDEFNRNNCHISPCNVKNLFIDGKRYKLQLISIDALYRLLGLTSGWTLGPNPAQPN